MIYRGFVGEGSIIVIFQSLGVENNNNVIVLMFVVPPGGNLSFPVENKAVNPTTIIIYPFVG